MANFSDLFFTAHQHLPGATQAVFDFPNGYAISVITGEHAYTSQSHPYEVAIVLNGVITYDTLLTDDVLGHQTAADISEIMAQVAAFPPT